MNVWEKTYQMIVHKPENVFTILFPRRTMSTLTNKSWITVFACDITDHETKTVEEINHNKTASYISQYFENAKDKLTRQKLLLSLVPKNTYQIILEKPFISNEFMHDDSTYNTTIKIYSDNTEVANGFLSVDRSSSVSFELQNKGVLTQPQFVLLYLRTFDRLTQMLMMLDEDCIDDDESTHDMQKEITELLVTTHTIMPKLISPNCCILQRNTESELFINIYYDLRKFVIEYVDKIYDLREISTLPKINRTVKIEMSHGLVCSLRYNIAKQIYKINVKFYDIDNMNYLDMGHIIHYLV